MICLLKIFFLAVCSLLEQEKSGRSQLQQTWQMANDQFLESQRLQMMDMRRMESVLTEEQQRRVEELAQKDKEREEQEEKIRLLQEKRESLEKRHSKEHTEVRGSLFSLRSNVGPTNKC